MIKAKNQERIEKLLDACGVSRAPVPVKKVASHLDIDVRFAPTKPDVSGALIVNGKEAYIAVNSTHHENRQRFTIAHEIGHYCLHKDGDHVHFDGDFRVYARNGRSALAIDVHEIEANQFAAELLMPTEMLRSDFVKLRAADESAIATLATKYRVSGKAMEFRLQNLGFILPGID